MEIDELHNTLFPPKELYLCSCSPRGKLPLLEGKSAHYKRKAQYENLHLAKGMRFTKLGNPILQPYTGPTDFIPVRYTQRKKFNDKRAFVHFFEEDFRWASAIWGNLEGSIHSIHNFEGMFAPDFSLYCDYKNRHQFELVNRWQIYRSRFVASYAQRIGYNVIPVASCGDIDSFAYCYDGLPENSIIGFCGTGINTHSHRIHLEYALRELEKQKHPLKIIIYGKEFTVEGLNTPLEFIEDQITKFHRNDK